MLYSSRYLHLTRLQESLDPDVMKLGLLSESGQNVARINEQATYVSFGHKLLQEWTGAFCVARCLERTTDVKVNNCEYINFRNTLFFFKSIRCKLSLPINMAV